MPPDAADQPRHVLIIDDDRAYADELRARLERAGYQAIATSSTREMLAALRRDNASVAIYDLHAVDRIGVAFMARLREGRPNLLFVAMARDADRACAAQACRDGAVDFLDKSCDFEAIGEALERCFARQGVRKTSDAAYEALRRAKEDAEAANRAKSEFLASMSHELRTPLNAIIGFSEMMIHGVLGPIGSESYLSYIKDIHHSGSHLLSIINDILDFSKVESGTLELLENEVDLRQVVDSLLRLIGPRAGDAGVALSERIPNGLPTLWCDETKLKQMVLNLLSNAVKFTPSGGRVELEAASTPDGMTISVRDTGIGIAAADLSRVLQPFVQVDNSLSRRHEGTGLGLTLVKSMVEIHGGSLALASTLGQGTVATLTFPGDRLIAPLGRALRAAG